MVEDRERERRKKEKKVMIDLKIRSMFCDLSMTIELKFLEFACH